MEKKRYDLVIPEGTMRALRTFIVNKQEGQFKKGDISKWISIAINNLTAGYNTHAHSTQNPNPYNIPVGRLKVKNMMQDICNQYVQSISEVPLRKDKTILTKHLEQMIQDVTGHHDDRTIKKHKKDLIKYGYIKDVGYTGAFLIVDTGTDIEWIESLQEKQKQDEKQHNKAAAEASEEIKEFDSIMEKYTE